MSLKIEAVGDRLRISDGCDIDTVESCIESSDKTLKFSDSLMRARHSFEYSWKFLLHRHVGFACHLFDNGINLKLRCPTCNNLYTLNDGDLEIGRRAYRELRKATK